MFEKLVKQQNTGTKSNQGKICKKLFSKFQSKMNE